MTKLRILLAEDHKVMREGLRMVIDRERDMEVVGEADNGLAAIALTQQLRPDVVIMDVSMPELDGLKATEALKRLVPNAKILILTRHTDSSYVKQLLTSGASGYVLKQSASEDLVRAIQRVAAGHTYLDPAITDQVVSSFTDRRRHRGSPGKSLSRREQEVLRFVALGLLTKEIAARLQISIKTVETHKANAMTKMGMDSRIDIVRYAVLQGWLQDA
ncbi:MAG TPA: response regulator transcription factor [Gemmatimonadaceae bacterium]|nr:response regulator transcription factor [Gemmatimonadaceae bacterium]